MRFKYNNTEHFASWTTPVYLNDQIEPGTQVSVIFVKLISFQIISKPETVVPKSGLDINGCPLAQPQATKNFIGATNFQILVA